MTHLLFPGDKKRRASTVQTRSKCRRFTVDIECLDNVTYSMFDASQNKPSTRSVSARLCGYFKEFEQHVESWAQRKNLGPCEACDADYYTICGLCNVPIHFFQQRVCKKNKTWLLKYHSDTLFVLPQSDSTLLGKTRNEWKEPRK